MSYEEYRALPDDGNRYEVIGGELLMTAAPLVDHQNISANLQFILDTYIRANKWGKLFNAPVEVFLGEEEFVQPDIICISKARLQMIARKISRARPTSSWKFFRPAPRAMIAS